MLLVDELLLLQHECHRLSALCWAHRLRIFMGASVHAEVSRALGALAFEASNWHEMSGVLVVMVVGFFLSAPDVVLLWVRLVEAILSKYLVVVLRGCDCLATSTCSL